MLTKHVAGQLLGQHKEGKPILTLEKIHLTSEGAKSI